MSSIMEIDGSVMEGGGQILRMALGFSVFTRTPVKIFNIRAGRKSPGLRPQHLVGVRLVRDISKGTLIGDNIGSTAITFHPGEIEGGDFKCEIGTAGSVMLLFQVSLPLLLYAKKHSRLTLIGGTNVDFAPQVDHTLMVFKPIAETMGIKFNCTIKKRGYFPRGGGCVTVEVNSLKEPLKPIVLLDPGNLIQIKGRAFVAGKSFNISQIIRDGACSCLKNEFPNTDIEIIPVREPNETAFGQGSGIILVAETNTNCLLGGSALETRGSCPTDIGVKAAKELSDFIKKGACVDDYIQDQLIIFMALAQGKSQLRTGKLTEHTKTAIFIAEKMTKARYTVCESNAEFGEKCKKIKTGKETLSSEECIIECLGISYI